MPLPTGETPTIAVEDDLPVVPNPKGTVRDGPGPVLSQLNLKMSRRA